jgi:hypothetical protein
MAGSGLFFFFMDVLIFWKSLSSRQMSILNYWSWDPYQSEKFLFPAGLQTKTKKVQILV